MGMPNLIMFSNTYAHSYLCKNKGLEFKYLLDFLIDYGQHVCLHFDVGCMFKTHETLVKVSFKQFSMIRCQMGHIEYFGNMSNHLLIL